MANKNPDSDQREDRHEGRAREKKCGDAGRDQQWDSNRARNNPRQVPQAETKAVRRTDAGETERGWTRAAHAYDRHRGRVDPIPANCRWH